MYEFLIYEQYVAVAVWLRPTKENVRMDTHQFVHTLQRTHSEWNSQLLLQLSNKIIFFRILPNELYWWIDSVVNLRHFTFSITNRYKKIAYMWSTNILPSRKQKNLCECLTHTNLFLNNKKHLIDNLYPKPVSTFNYLPFKAFV